MIDAKTGTDSKVQMKLVSDYVDGKSRSLCEASFNSTCSEESLKAWQEEGLEYPNTLTDYWMQQFDKLTRKTSEKDTKRYIGSMMRFIDREGKQYIIYNMSVRKHDPLGNRKEFYYPNVGVYTKPVVHKEFVVDPEEGYEKKVVVKGYDGYDTCYSIPFNDKNIDTLLKWTDGNTHFVIKKEDYQSGRKLTIRSLNDWRTGNFVELLRFGHIASDYEKQILEDEKIGKYVTTGTQGAYR